MLQRLYHIITDSFWLHLECNCYKPIDNYKQEARMTELGSSISKVIHHNLLLGKHVQVITHDCLGFIDIIIMIMMEVTGKDRACIVEKMLN